jgi:hypothetical protein
VLPDATVKAETLDSRPNNLTFPTAALSIFTLGLMLRTGLSADGDIYVLPGLKPQILTAMPVG